jgi:hypothetical protein
MNECSYDTRAIQDHRRSGNGRVARHFVSVAPSTDLAIAVSFMSGVADGGQHTNVSPGAPEGGLDATYLRYATVPRAGGASQL